MPPERGGTREMKGRKAQVTSRTFRSAHLGFHSDEFTIRVPEPVHLGGQRRAIQEEDAAVSAFNIGINSGKDAGQTVGHCHVHLIPRRLGDVETPEGGVRGVIPDKQKYSL